MARRRRPRPERGHIYPTLDLHGETADSARRRAAEWLRRQRDAGERLVVIITGRGKHSRGVPVLRDEISLLLDELRGELVGQVEAERGEGALRVELLSPRGVAAGPRPLPAPRASAELLRRAEESLAELGVAPTPEMLRIEIERLRRGG